MRRTLYGLLTLAALGAAGCQPATTPESDPASHASGKPEATPGAGATDTQGQGGINPVGSMGAGGLTPVAGAESVQGSGSGVGQAAKNMARETAATAPSSLNSGAEDTN